MLYIFYNGIDKNSCAKLVLNEIRNPNVELIEAGKYFWHSKNNIVKLLLRIGFCLHIPFLCNYDVDFIKKVAEIKSNDKILIFGGGIISPRGCYSFLHILKANKKSLWLWDSVQNKKQEKYLNYLKKHFDVVSFDFSDAEKYGLRYKNTVCRYPKKIIQDSDITTDIYFVGQDRGRYEILNSLYEKFNAMDLKCEFLVIRDETSPITENSLKFSECWVSSEENQLHISKSRAVLDIPAKWQHGLTQRTLEALFQERKVITNNTWIEKEKLYTKENIFVFDKSNLNGIKAFLNQPFQKIDVSDYQINEWIKEFV